MPAFHEFLLGTINGRVQLQVQGPIPRAFMLHRKWNERSTGGVSRCPKEYTVWVGSARQIRQSVRLASRGFRSHLNSNTPVINLKIAHSAVNPRLYTFEVALAEGRFEICKGPRRAYFLSLSCSFKNRFLRRSAAVSLRVSRRVRPSLARRSLQFRCGVHLNGWLARSISR